MLSASEAPPVKTTSARVDAQRLRGRGARVVQTAARLAPGPVRLGGVAEVLAQERLHRLPGLVADRRGRRVIGVDAHARSLRSLRGGLARDRQPELGQLLGRQRPRARP